MPKDLRSHDQRLQDAIIEFARAGDYLGLVMFLFPWGQKGTILENEYGPDGWQMDILEMLGDGLTLDVALRIAVSSGNGIGKSALIAWIILIFILTRDHPQIVVTANSEQQLRNKTWRELAKWHKMCICEKWMSFTATKLSLKRHPETWFASAVTWSEHNAQAFAGTHERNVIVIFDEASEIPDIIKENADGAMTTPGAMMIAFGNPSKNSGWFYQAVFGDEREMWRSKIIDSRTTKHVNQAELQTWADTFGDDSDYFRIHVRGLPPRGSMNTVIGLETVEIARKRNYEPSIYNQAPKVVSADVARRGGDESVVGRRQGLKAFPQLILRDMDGPKLANHIIDVVLAWEAEDGVPVQVIFVEATGVGWSCVDHLKLMGYGKRVVPVEPGSQASKSQRYANVRAEMWDNLNEWLKEGGQIPDEPILCEQLCMPEKDWDNRDRLKIQSKDDMKKSPDRADQLALSLARPVRAERQEIELDLRPTVG